MIAWMMYASVVMLLLAMAAAAVEPLLQERFAGSRFLWLGVLLVGAIAGLGLPLVAAPTVESTKSAAFPVEAASLDQAFSQPLADADHAGVTGDKGAGRITASAMVTGAMASAARFRDAAATRLTRFDGAAGVAWLLASLLSLAALSLSVLRLHQLRSSGRVRRFPGLDLVFHPSRGPAAAGVVRPWVLLPGWSGALPREQKRLLLRHEFEHVRGWDPPLKLAGAMVVAVMPWNAAAWWAMRRLNQAMETDCDRRVVARCGHPRDYARFLLDVAAGRRIPLAAGGAMHLTGNLERRLLAMTSPQRSAPHQRLLRTVLAVSAVGALVALRAPAAPAFAQSGEQAPEAVQTAREVVAEYGSVGGTVVDHDGEPIAGAQVRVAEAEVGTVSDQTGRFLIPRLPEDTYRLLVSAPGYRSHAVNDVRVVSGQRAQVTVTLARPGQGQAPPVHHPPIDQPAPERPAPERPVPGTATPASPSVVREVAVETGMVGGTIVDNDGEPLPGVEIRVADAQIGTVSDPTGRFLIPRLREGTYRLLVSAPGYRAYTVEDVRVIAGERTQVTVTLARTGQPQLPAVHHAPVPQRPLERPAPAPPAPPASAVTPEPNPVGGARPAPVALPLPAPVTLPRPAAEPAPSPAPVREVSVPQAAPPPSAPPPPPPPQAIGDYRIRGVVVDSAGQPVRGVYVRLLGTNRGTIADANGRFTLALAEPGTYSLQLIAPGFVTREVEAVAALGEGSALQVVLTDDGR